MAVDFTLWNDIVKFNGKVFQEYNLVDIWRDWMSNVRDLNDAAQSTIPVVQKRVATEVDAGSDRWTESTTTERSTKLVHQKSIEGNEKLTWEQGKKVPYSIADEYATRLALDAATAKMMRVCSWMIGNTPNGTNNDDALDHVRVKDLSSGRAQKVADFIKEANVLFHRQNLPAGRGERIMFLDPAYFSELWSLETVVKTTFGGGGGVRQFTYNGLPMGGVTSVIEYADWLILQTNGSFGLNLVAGQADATANGFTTKTASKFRVDCSDFKAVGFHRRCIATGYATMGNNHIEAGRPTWSPQYKSWFFNTACIMDLVSIQKAAPTTAALDADEDSAWINAPGIGLVALKNGTDESAAID